MRGSKMHEQDRAAVLHRYRERYKEFGYDPRTLGWTKGRQDVRFAAALEGIGEFSSILDVGCGFGDLYRFLRNRGWNGEYVGVDLVPELIEEAKTQHADTGAAFLCQDLEDEPLDRRFDVVVGIGMFNHLLVGGNLVFIREMLQRMFEHADGVVVTDFISSTAEIRYPHLFYAEPADIWNICASLSRRILLAHHYMPFEFIAKVWRDDAFSTEVPVFEPFRYLVDE
jgi:SAM-dependent methyltransferase